MIAPRHTVKQMYGDASLSLSTPSLAGLVNMVKNARTLVAPDLNRLSQTGLRWAILNSIAIGECGVLLGDLFLHVSDGPLEPSSRPYSVFHAFDISV